LSRILHAINLTGLRESAPGKARFHAIVQAGTGSGETCQFSFESNSPALERLFRRLQRGFLARGGIDEQKPKGQNLLF
jgi:hypothetical protein